jgi:glycosyltransferase involved in cell wall biosynthesis
VRVALVHDYLTQRGGAERVVLSMLKAFPGAPLYTSLYLPEGTFPEFGQADVRTLALDRVGLLRRHHRLALPLLAPAFSRLRVDADVVVTSSSGWAHGIRTTGKKIVYCHTPARWLYQTAHYLGDRARAPAAALALLRPFLASWDRRAAASARRYLVNSTVVKARVREQYGIEAEVLPPPPALDPEGPVRPVHGLEPSFVLCVSRLLPYKNVDAILAAFGALPEARLTVVGTGPSEDRLRAGAPRNVTFVRSVSDQELRWLYASCSGVVAASHEDYGLTPLEAAAFGKPTAALRKGGYLDTVLDGETGVFFDAPTREEIAAGVGHLLERDWNTRALTEHAERFGESRFIRRLREVVVEEARPAC